MGRFTAIAQVAVAAATITRLENQIKLEYKYQKLSNIDAQNFFYPPKNATRHPEPPQSMQELVDIYTTYQKESNLSTNTNEQAYRTLRSRLDTWSKSYGTKTRSAASIMREYTEFADDKLLKERKKDEDKAKKELEKAKEKELKGKRKEGKKVTHSGSTRK